MSRAALFTLLTLGACKEDPKTSDPDTVNTVTAGGVSQAVVLVLDGTRVEESFGYEETTAGFSDAHDGDSETILPAMTAELLGSGGYCSPAFNTGSTITMPAHTTLLQGRRRNYGSPATQEGGIGLYRPELPTLFELLRAQEGLPPESVALVGNTVNIVGIDYSLYPGYGSAFGAEYVMLTKSDSDAPTDDDGEVVDAVQAALTGGARIVVANLHGIDRTAHNVPESYAEAVAAVDNPIFQLWRWIQSEESGLKDDTLLVVTADHGRHRFDDLEPVWSGHGDHCSGCREIPLLLLGPGVVPGAVTSTPYTHEDIHQTIAWMLGLESPYADGLVIEELLSLGDAAPVSRSGSAAPAASGALQGHLRWLDDPAHRSEIVIDGDVFSDDDLFAMEAPVVYRGEIGDVACWRQLALSPGDDYFPWTLRCVQRADASEPWSELGAPLERLPPDVVVSLAEDSEGRLVLATSNLLLNESVNISNNSKISLATLIEGEWVVSGTHSLADLAIEPSLRAGPQSLWLAYTRGESGPTNRYTRHIEIQEIAASRSGDTDWRKVWSSDDDPLSASYGRMEHPALWADGALGQVAFFGFTDSGAELLLAHRTDGAWGGLESIDDQQPLSHVAPAWSEGGALFWTRHGSPVSLCRRWQDATDCTPLQGDAAERIAATSDDEAVVSVLGEDMAWSLQTVSF